jgi:hypothetical protein
MLLISLSIALLGGIVWNLFGFQCVFLIGVVIAALGFLAANRIQPRNLHVENETSTLLQGEFNFYQIGSLFPKNLLDFSEALSIIIALFLPS